MAIKEDLCVFWFRRDLRLYDNAGLYHALRENPNVLPLFIFDTDILDKLDEKNDRRVEFIHLAISNLQSQLIKLNSSLFVEHGSAEGIFKELIRKHKIKSVY